MMRYVEHAIHMKDMRHAHRILDVKPEGKKQLGNLGLDRRKILKWALKKQCEHMGCTHLAQNRVQLQTC
jgi:hypothetical protein